ncbi:MAG: 6-bladed beta-propeller, partial [Candidatus Nitrosocosmicus sp.]|nr:6-bladed beta-propeller [Candidatus Nitrosocosmicus sp.]
MSSNDKNMVGMKCFGNEQILNLFNVNKGKWTLGYFITIAFALFGIASSTTSDFYSPMAFGQSVSQPQNLSFTYYTNWGSEGEDDGQFGGQNDVDFFDGRVFVPDYENHRIQIFDPEGNFLTKFGEGGEGDGQFHKASALSMDSEGNIYVADQFNYRIQKFDN